ncbi:MAG TPA: 50S ribosomal protein L10 [Candidatus Portnoybacteria bacterium]|nr:50S ribosomal protein L10 [Candidatus Portnoybacteria bacterium]
MQTKAQKQDIVKDLTDKLKKAKAAVFADYTGMSVAKLTELRRKLRSKDNELKVAKKTLIDLAVKNAGISNLDARNLPGQMMVVMGFSDEVASAKTIFEFDKKGEQVKILGGILENNFIDKQGVLSLAKLPSKQELLAKAVGSMAAPLTGMLNVLQGNIRGLVQVLSQIKK